MTYQRLHYSAAELAAMHGRPRAVSWPSATIVVISLFALGVPDSLLTGMNLYLLLMVGIGWLATRSSIERPLVQLVLPFAMLLLVGLVGGAIAGTDTYLYFKDAWYCSNPMVVVALGYLLCRIQNDPRAGLRAFVVAGAVAAVWHLSKFALRPQMLLESSSAIRTTIGLGYVSTALAVIVLAGWWGRWREGLGIRPGVALPCLVLCSVSCALSFSRTLTLLLLVGGLAMAGYFRRSELVRVGALLAAGLLALAALQGVVALSPETSTPTFIGKMARSLEELDVEDYTTLKAINDNWRGYETARALIAWREGNLAQQMFGLGFGAQVDIGFFQDLSGTGGANAVRFIPIFHNGYIYLLVKTGVAGVLLYVALLAWLYRVGRRTASGPLDDPRTLRGRALQGCALALLVSTWIIAGAFNKFGLVGLLLMVGHLLASVSGPAPEKTP